MTAHNIHVKGGNCAECDFPLDEFGDCTNSDCDTNLISETDLHDPYSDESYDILNDGNSNDEEDEDETDEYELGVD